MCGIFAIFSKNSDSNNINNVNCGCDNKSKLNNKINLRELAYYHSGKQRHRGPDYTGVEVINDSETNGVMIHERLAVVCVRSGKQPLKNYNENILLSANGEIYNYLEISENISKIRGEYKPRGDCDVIISLYEEYGLDLFQIMIGMFAFVLYDKENDKILIARDPMGIIPIYQGVDEEGNLWVASEMKCLVGKCKKVQAFPPGSYSYGHIGCMKTTKYYHPNWMKKIPTSSVDIHGVRKMLESAVRTHLQCDKDVPFGALLSGGVDSSLIASIATKIKRETNPKFRLKTYSVGLQGAPDFEYSQMVADFIDSDHTEVKFTIEEGLDCIRDIIYHLESYDVTTIRASIPMFILSRYIKSEGLKMVLSGEGADEIFGGYLYFHSAPNYEDFHYETVSRVKNLHLSDCLRANKSTMSWGVELRVPFLDTSFVNYAMNIAPEDRIPGEKNRFSREHILHKTNLYRMEKFILRASFAKDYLPNEVLWRQKEQFSDGVGYDWIDTIRRYTSSHISDLEFSEAPERYSFNTPSTKEAYYYRKLFDEMFPGEEYAKTVMKWVPRTDWGCSPDPSGRTQSVHVAFK